MTEWISVEERLPEEEGSYLCVQRWVNCSLQTETTIDVLPFYSRPLDRQARKTMIIEGKRYLTEPAGDLEFWEDDVTHWMPLPPFPKGTQANSNEQN